MRPLKALVLIKDRPLLRARQGRNMGMWSYAVPEFTWEYRHFGNGFWGERERICDEGFDFVFHEDGGNWGTWKKAVKGRLPVVYHAIDSTLSARHLEDRRRQAAESDLCLVEHDNPDRFIGVGVPIRRLPYAVNDRVFYQREKVLDVLCAQGRTSERRELERFVSEYCAARGLIHHVGPLGFSEYAEAMGRAKVVICKPRVPGNRPHRVFDALASGALLVTGELPRSAAWDGLDDSAHYLSWSDLEELELQIGKCFDSVLVTVAGRHRRSGYDAVMKNHTWAVRSAELRQMLADTFPSLA